METHARILVVASHDNFRTTLCRILRRCGYEADVTPSGEQAVLALQHHPYDLVLTEVALPGICGLTVLCRNRQAGKQVPFVILTECHTERMRSILNGVDGVRCLSLPLNVDRLKRVVAESIAGT